MISKSNLILFLLCIYFLMFVNCQHKYEKIHSDIIFCENAKHNQDTILIDSLQNLNFSRLNKFSSCGMEFIYNVPKNIQNIAVCVVFSGRVRTNYAFSNAAVVCSAFSEKKEKLFWNSINLRNVFIGINNWSTFRDSIFFPSDFYGQNYNVISGHLFLGESKAENFDIDTLKIEIKKLLN